MVSINDLPTELVHKILVQIPCKDVLNYCRTCSIYKLVISDTMFWKSKLDYDFIFKTDNGRILIPSLYVKLFSSNPEGWCSTYKRWYMCSHTTYMLLCYGCQDFVIYNSDKYD